MNFKLKGFSFIIVLTLILAACGNETSQSEDTESKDDTSNLKEVSVMLDWYPKAIHGYL